MKGLSVGGAGFTRSSALKKFRKAMKRAARVQAISDLQDAAKARTGPGAGTATADYEEMAGGNIAYGAVKPEIDIQLEEEAKKIVADLNLPLKIFDDVEKAILDGFTAHPANQDKARAAGKRKIKELTDSYHDKLKAGKDQVVGKDRGAPQDGAETTTEGQDVIGRVVDRVKKQKVGKKSLKEAINAPTVGRGMKFLGKLIDNVIPDSGESVELAITFVIPTGQPGLNVEIHLMGMAARGINGATTAGVAVMGDPKRVEVAAKLSVGVGAEAIGLKASAAVGIFIRAGSDQGSEAALQALAYGAYRGAPTEAFQNLWAPEDKASEVIHKAKNKGDAAAAQLPERTKRQRAEMWAAMIEEKYFKGQDAFADVGMAIDGGFGANVGFMEAELSINESIFSHYDEKLLKEKLGDKFASRVLDDASAKKRRGAATGDKKLTLGASLGLKIGAGSHFIELALSVSGEDSKNWGVEIVGGASLNSDAASASDYDKIANGWVTGLAEMIKKIRATASKQINDDATGVWGNILQTTADFTTLWDAGSEFGLRNAMASATEHTVEASAFNTPIGQTAESAVEKVSALAASTSLQFVLTFGLNDGKLVVRFEVRSKRGLDIGGGTPVNISASKTTRLFAIGRELDGKMHGEILGGRVE